MNPLLHLFCVCVYILLLLLTAVWRVACCAMSCCVSSDDDMHRTCFALMATWSLLKDPAACSQLIANKRLASGLMSVVAGRGSRDKKWVSNDGTPGGVGHMRGQEVREARARRGWGGWRWKGASKETGVGPRPTTRRRVVSLCCSLCDQQH